MKYALSIFFCILFLNVSFAQTEMTTTRAQRSQLGQMEQTKKSAQKTFMIALNRYQEAVKISDEESQKEIKKDMLMRMTDIIAHNESLLREAPRSEANKTQFVETKTNITKQNTLLKKAGKSVDAQKMESLMLEFLETLK